MVPDVFFYVPNLIGYVRVLTGIGSFAVALRPSSHHTFLALYFLSAALDAVDGVAARRLNQCSRLGAVLDMVTDRFATMGLLCVLSHLYPSYFFAFVLLMILDIVSHWFQMYSTLLVGRSTHKTKAGSGNRLLEWYYSFPYALFFMCAGNECFLIALYALKFTVGPFWLSTTGLYVLVANVCAPVFVFKQVISVIQLLDAATTIALHDQQHKV